MQRPESCKALWPALMLHRIKTPGVRLEVICQENNWDEFDSSLVFSRRTWYGTCIRNSHRYMDFFFFSTQKKLYLLYHNPTFLQTNGKNVVISLNSLIQIVRKWKHQSEACRSNSFARAKFVFCWGETCLGTGIRWLSLRPSTFRWPSAKMEEVHFILAFKPTLY